VGADDAASAGNHTPGYFQLTRWTASASGSCTRIRVKGGGAGHAKVAIYADSSGSPGALLMANNTGQGITAAGWQDIPLPSPVAITAGTAYWLAINSDAACLGFVSPASNNIWYKPVSYSGFSFPNPAGSGFGSYSGYTLTAGWGSSTPPAPPATPVLVSPLASVYFEWGSSAGATKYTLQVNSAPTFDGVSLFNSDITATSQVVSGFSTATTYYWRVRSGNDSGYSSWTSVKSILVNNYP
jgi:hypothetical protein